MDTQTIILTLQTIIFFLTPIITWFIFNQKNKLSIKNAAKSISLQIKDIEKNIEYLKIECIDPTGTISEQTTFNSDLIYDQNYWEIYRHLLFNYLTSNEYELISNFYNNASMIKRFQIDIKNFILYSLQSRANFRNQILLSLISINNNSDDVKNILNDKMDIYDKVIVHSYVPKHYGQYTSTYLAAFQPLSGTVAYTALIRICGN